MKSFLITFKPSEENPRKGWPLRELQRLVERIRKGAVVREDWRFHNSKDVSLGDRAFLLLQGKKGPAIIGHGTIVGEPYMDGETRRVPIEFQQLVDPTVQPLVSKEEILRVKSGSKSWWRTQNSGIFLPIEVATQLEELVLGRTTTRVTQRSGANPDWTRDELIVALSVYLRHRGNPPGKGSEEIQELSRTLNLLGRKLFGAEQLSPTFRNENGVYMKLMNFRRLDPNYTSQGKKGLSSGNKEDAEVWRLYEENEARCFTDADAIIKAIADRELDVIPHFEDDFHEAAEGKLLTRKHVVRERNRELVKRKRGQVLKQKGLLACEACSFDFSREYGERGAGFLECHHVNALGLLAVQVKTRLEDLALICANCHRMIHRRSPWLTISELKELMRKARTARAGAST